MEETDKFKDKYKGKLEDKEKFYEEQKQWDKENEGKASQEEDIDTSSADLKNLVLDGDILDDIKYGADNIRIGLKEKYLGRNAGAKRGETVLQYVPSTLTLVISGTMFSVLAYVQRQVNIQAKNKMW